MGPENDLIQKHVCISQILSVLSHPRQSQCGPREEPSSRRAKASAGSVPWPWPSVRGSVTKAVDSSGATRIRPGENRTEMPVLLPVLAKLTQFGGQSSSSERASRQGMKTASFLRSSWIPACAQSPPSLRSVTTSSSQCPWDWRSGPQPRSSLPGVSPCCGCGSLPKHIETLCLVLLCLPWKGY